MGVYSDNPALDAAMFDAFTSDSGSGCSSHFLSGDGKGGCGCVIILVLLGALFWGVKSCSTHIKEELREINHCDDFLYDDSCTVDIEDTIVYKIPETEPSREGNSRSRYSSGSRNYYNDCYYYENDDDDEYDEDGYDSEGYDRDGYDRYGYDRDGYDEDGIDDEGYDEDGNYSDDW